jgi:hypothetical protein
MQRGIGAGEWLALQRQAQLFGAEGVDGIDGGGAAGGEVAREPGGGE